MKLDEGPAKVHGESSVAPSWWLHPAVLSAAVGAVLAGAFGLITVVIDGDSGPGPNDSLTGISVALESEIGSFYVACPTTIVFEGEISVSSGSGEVSYRFVHTDVFGGMETKEPVEKVMFSGAASATVRHEWIPTVPVGEVFRTAAIELLSPASIRSNDVTVIGTCDASLPQGPPTPPPDVAPPSG